MCDGEFAVAIVGRPSMWMSKARGRRKSRTDIGTDSVHKPFRC
jgi:hypothetical protein